MIKSNPLRYFLEVFKHEKEIISLSPFNFDSEDIKYIISSSLMQKYYNIPDEFNDKFLFLEDYCSSPITINSPLFFWIKQKDRELEKSGIQGVDKDIFVAFQILNGIIIHPEWKAYVTPIPKQVNGIPERWNQILKNMHKYPNDELKMPIIDYIFRAYVLHKIAPNMVYEDDLYKEISNIR